MLALLKKVLGWILKIPVLFAHFPGPSLMLVLGVVIASGSVTSCITHQIEAGARAEISIELAQCEAGHANAVAEAAKAREGIVVSAFEEKAAIDRENQKAILEQLKQLVATANDKAAIARLNKLIEDMKNDPAFACRLLPLPRAYTDGVSFPAEEVKPATGGP
jgi:hypothetical protein